MTRGYRDQLLLVLGDGEWHAAQELAHPNVCGPGVEVWIRILRASGHEIVREGEGTRARYRLVANPTQAG